MSLIGVLRGEAAPASLNWKKKAFAGLLFQFNEIAAAELMSPGKAWRALIERRRTAKRVAERTMCRCRACREDTGYGPCVED